MPLLMLLLCYAAYADIDTPFDAIERSILRALIQMLRYLLMFFADAVDYYHARFLILRR